MYKEFSDVTVQLKYRALLDHTNTQMIEAIVAPMQFHSIIVSYWTGEETMHHMILSQDVPAMN